MSRLDDYRSAMLAVFSEIPREVLEDVVDAHSADFVSFVVDHGLGPLWHTRSGRQEFYASRMAAESLYLAQQGALEGIDAVLSEAGVQYAVIKGAANRLLLCENAAIRACHDIDLLVCPEERVHATTVLIENGYAATPKLQNISHELELSKGAVNVDLHWGLLREGRLRNEAVTEMLERRRRLEGVWMLHEDDSLFLLLVHPAFAKHLAGWDMGLHRVADIIDWLNTQAVNWADVRESLARNGVQSAAWATLRWVQMLAQPHMSTELEAMLADIQPGRLRRAYLDRWLHADLSARLSSMHWARLFGFSLFLHDTAGDARRALKGRHNARIRQEADLAAFENLLP